MMKSNNEFFIWIILTSMATAFSFAVDNNQMNLLLVGVMATIPFLLIIHYPKLYKKEKIIYLFFFSLVISAIFHSNTLRISTLLYSLMFLLTFIYYIRSISSIPFEIDRYIKVLRFILIAYFLVLIIQQLCVFFGSTYILNFIAGDSEIYKLNALSPEPSHTARIISAVMYSLVCMQELKMRRSYSFIWDARNNIMIWFVFLYSMLTMGSGFAIVLLLFFLLRFLKIRGLLYLLPLLFITSILVLSIDLPAVGRVVKFGQAFIKLDPNLMIEADHSASIRVVPTILYLNTLDFFSLNTWLGFGTDYSSNLIPTQMPGISEGAYRGGLFPGFFLDRGLLCVIILFTMIYQFCLNKLFSYNTLFLLILIFASGINTQLFWISILLFTTNKYFYDYYLKTENCDSENE